MANRYIRSGAGGAATGADWANAYLTMKAAFDTGAGGDIFWIADDHSESTGSTITLAITGTSAATPAYVYCVDRTGSVPPVAADLRTTAVFATTAGASLSIGGAPTTYAYFYGIQWNINSQIQMAVGGDGWIRFDSCKFQLNNSISSGPIQVGALGTGTLNRIDWNNCTVEFSNTGQKIALQNTVFSWKDTASALLGTIPTFLFLNTSAPSIGYIEGVDLSGAGSGKTLVGDATICPSRMYFKDCKLNASVTLAVTPSLPGLGEAEFTRCDSGATNYRTEKYTYYGTQTVETTIVRTGGATDETTSIAWKIITTANSKWVFPFEAMPIAFFNETAGSPITVTIHGIWGDGAVPNDDEVWIDVEYLGSASDPQGSYATSTKASNLSTGSALPSDSSTWGGSTTAFKMSASFTAQQRGAVYVHVKAAKVSSTFYIDPNPVVT